MIIAQLDNLRKCESVPCPIMKCVWSDIKEPEQYCEKLKVNSFKQCILMIKSYPLVALHQSIDSLINSRKIYTEDLIFYIKAIVC